MPFFVYILRTSANTLYTGYTTNLEKRIKAHQSKNGAKYTRAFKSCELVYTEEFETRSDAMKREYEIKQLTKAEKEKLVLYSNL